LLTGVISDSHDNLELLKKALRELMSHRVQLVFHLGDFISPFTVKLMKELLGDIPVIGVKGNNDGDIYQLLKLFTQYNWALRVEPSIVNVGERKILLVHGYGSVEETTKLVDAWTNSLNVDVVLYGHTHRVDLRRVGGKLILNPGEICGYLTSKSSYAVLDLKNLEADVYIL
jgi:putative phosphoesterase